MFFLQLPCSDPGAGNLSEEQEQVDSMESMEKKGLVIVHTGEGKGKTTAALGLAIRAWGDGLRVLILQFIKGSREYGELEAVRALGKVDGRIRVEQCGLGFTRRGGEAQAEHASAAGKALLRAEEAMKSGAWDMVILDEVNYAVKFGLIAEHDLMGLLDARPEELHLVLTGRDALPSLVERADLVTEMTLVKHPYQKGIKAQRGIEF